LSIFADIIEKIIFPSSSPDLFRTMSLD